MKKYQRQAAAKELFQVLESLHGGLKIRQRPRHWYDAGACVLNRNGGFGFV
jgi:hypothetical protein